MKRARGSTFGVSDNQADFARGERGGDILEGYESRRGCGKGDDVCLETVMPDEVFDARFGLVCVGYVNTVLPIRARIGGARHTCSNSKISLNPSPSR